MKTFQYLSIFCLIFLWSAFSLEIQAQSPRNLNNDIQPLHDFIGTITVEQIEANFNNARRQEEMQLGLAANSIQNLDLPDQATWNGYSYDQKMLFLLNDERTARAGINYGDGPCLGLPFEGVESSIDQIANDYAQFLIDNNIDEHNPNLGSQMDNSSSIGGSGCMPMTSGTQPNCCHQELPRDENLAGAGSSNNNINAPVEDAVYGWNYVDADCQWGHREMCLLQNDDLPWSPGNIWGFSDDWGDNGKAGMIGVGVGETSNAPGGGYRKVVVLNYFDPAPTCNFTLTVDTDNLGGGNGGGCSISSITAGNQTACDPNTNTYSQDVTITFSGAPGTGNLVVHGQNFAIGTSPQTVTLANLTADGQAVNVTAHFSDMPACTSTQANVFTAPNACNGGGGCNATTINCGQTVSGDTNTGTNNFSGYNCQPWDETGKELVYQITTTSMGNITAALSNINGGDLDIFILNACNNNNCVAGEDETAAATNQPAGTYYIIVDGYEGESGTFDLLVTANCGTSGCTAPPPATGIIPAGTYESDEAITTAGRIIASTQVVLQSSVSVTLDKNFEIEMGAVFEARIGNCFTSEEEVAERTEENNEPSLLNTENFQVFPNPFSKQTTITYQLDRPSAVTIHVFDTNGQEVTQLVNERLQANGNYQVVFDAQQEAAGVYFVLLRTINGVASRKLVLIK